MLDILLKQLELQDIEQHMGIHTNVCENVCRLLKCMVTAARVGLGSHVCALKVKLMENVIKNDVNLCSGYFILFKGIGMRLLRSFNYVASIINETRSVHGPRESHSST